MKDSTADAIAAVALIILVVIIAAYWVATR